MVRNVDLAEELAQDALVVAPSEWPKTGVPVNPGAWLMGTLRAVGRLTTDEIARAFLSSEATIAERIVRAKKVIAKAGLTFEAPSGRRGCPRCSRSSTSFSMKAIRPRRATTFVRPGLCLEAQRLGRVLAGLMLLMPKCSASWP